jgi:pimeloyl-ACP methyl ester carboxylesterase
MEPVVDEVLDLQDGRRLAYCEWGSREGAPVVFINGSPGSRLWIPDERVTEDRGVRLVTFDRPGTGRSDPKAPRRLSDVPLDVAALADALEIERFPVIGYSTGGVYAAACAALLGPRVTGAAIVSTRHLALYNVGERPESYDELDAESRAVYDLAQQDPLAAAEHCKQQDAEWVEQLRERPESIWDGPAEERAPEGDRWFWRDAERTASFYSSMREALSQGIEGYKWESLDVFLPWGLPTLRDLRPGHHLVRGPGRPLPGSRAGAREVGRRTDPRLHRRDLGRRRPHGPRQVLGHGPRQHPVRRIERAEAAVA